MIFDELVNAAAYRALSDDFAAGFEYLSETDFTDLADGRYEIRGSNVFAIVQCYTTKPREQGKWEAHRQHADIQFMIRGRERMGVAPISTMKVSTEYDADKDVAFYEGDGQFFTVGAGSFALFLPHDVHMPTLAAESAAPVKKVVIKVKLR